MQKILLQMQNPVLNNNTIFGPDKNGMNEPWRELKRRLTALGYDLMTADENPLDGCAWILFVDSASVDGIPRHASWKKILWNKLRRAEDYPNWPERPLYREAKERHMKDRVALFLWEGKVNNPNNYKREVWDKFKIIFTWDDDLVDNKKFFKFCLPTPTRPLPINPTPFAKKIKLLVNMSSNRYYANPQELYSARIKTSKYWCDRHPGDFDLYGGRWHTPVTRWQKLFPFLIPRFPCYLGITPDKIKTTAEYKFALAYENMEGAKGYVTEKIFDIMAAGTVPVYWGASNISKYVDPAAFVDRRRFKTEKALFDFLKGVTESEYGAMVAAGQKYLASRQFKQFLSEHFCDRVVETLKLNSVTAAKTA